MEGHDRVMTYNSAIIRVMKHGYSAVLFARVLVTLVIQCKENTKFTSLTCILGSTNFTLFYTFQAYRAIVRFRQVLYWSKYFGFHCSSQVLVALIINTNERENK